MAERDLTVAMSSDTSGFSEGIQQAKKILTELNKTLIENQSTLKSATQELNIYEKEQKKLQEEMDKSGNDTDENRKKMAQLTEQIQKQKEKVAQLKTEQIEIRGQISRATTALKNESNAFEEARKATAEIQSATGRLTSAISRQEDELKKLKQSYSDVVLEQGKESSEAKKLSQKISNLSDELNHNRAKLEESTYKSNDLDKAIENTGKTAKNTGDGFTVMKGAISNLVSDALNVAIDKFKEMSVSAEQSLNSLQAKTGMSAEAVGELKTEMLDLYKNNYGDSLTDVADKIALVTQNIDESDPQKIKDITQNAIALSDTFGSDFEENLRGVNALMTNMGLTSDEAFDLIAKGSQNGLDKSHELADNLAEYSQLWGQAGFSAEEMFSILQNGLDSGAYSLDKVNDLVGEMSKSIIDGRLEKNIKSFSDSTAQVFNSFKNGKATQKEVFDSMINDLNTTTGLAENLGKASDTWSALGEDNAMAVITALNNVNNTYKDVEGTMQEINDIQYNDVGSQLEALGRQFEVDILQPVVEKATPKIKEFISWVSDHLPEVTSALASLTAGVITYKTATAAGNFLKTLIEGFKSLKPAVAGATDAMKIHNTTVKANLYITLASAILSAVAAITTWIVTSKNATSATNDTTASVKKYTQAMESAKSTAENKEKSVNSEISMLKTLKGEYDELRNKTNLSTEEQKRLDNVAGEIAKTMGVTTDSLKNQSGAYKDLTSSVEDYIKQLKIKAQIENSQNILKEAYTVADEVTVEDVAKARSAYEAYKRELLSIKGKSEAEIEVLDSFSYADYSDDQIFNNKTNVMSIGGDWEKLKRLENTYAELDLQRSKALSTINEYEEKLKKALSEYENKTDATEKSTKSIEDETKAIEDLSKTMSEMSAKTTAVKNAEKEYKETQTLTASTLQAVIDKYPSLQEEVNKYMLGLTDTKSLIQSMKDVYQNDLNSYIGVISQKAYNSNIFYNQLINANASFVNAAKEQYGIDLMNFKNLQEAKQAMIAAEKSKIDKGWGNSTSWGDKFDLAGNLSKFNNAVKQYGSVNTYLANQAVERFINNSLSATTNLTNFFSTPSSESSGTGSTSSSSSKKDNKYELADAAYSRLIDKRIEKIKKEADVAEKAKDKKIAAINAEIEARKRLNEDADRQNELEEINAQLEYSRLDKLSRRELERKKQDLLNEQTQINWERMMSDKKDKIESDYSKQEKSYSSAMDYLQKAAESAKNYFSKLAGTQTSSQIVNNNSDTRNIQIVSNALSNQQMLDKLLNALYSK
jgi:phage-related minor tail protein